MVWLRSCAIASCVHWALQPGLGIAAEHGYFFRAAGASGWESLHDGEDGAVHAWREMVLPILQVKPCEVHCRVAGRKMV